MIGYISTGPTQLTLGLTAVYLVIGVGLALRVGRAGHPPLTAVSAVIGWPMLLSILVPGRGTHSSSGPMAGRIEQALDDLMSVLHDPAAGGAAFDTDLAGLRAALHRADERLGLADRLLQPCEIGSTRAPGLPEEVVVGLDCLVAARAQAEAEIDSVLSAVVQLRIQVGIRALAGNSAPVRERLHELSARAAALEELTSHDLFT